MRGSFVNKSPHIEFKIWGLNPGQPVTYTGLIDTGFNGYLVLPFANAFPLGLALIGTESSTIADGSSVTSLLCLGTVELCGVKVTTAVSVQTGNSILIGTQLLEKVGKDLFVDFVGGTVEFKHRPQPKSQKPTTEKKPS